MRQINLISHPNSVFWYSAQQSKYWPYKECGSVATRNTNLTLLHSLQPDPPNPFSTRTPLLHTSPPSLSLWNPLYFSLHPPPLSPSLLPSLYISSPPLLISIAKKPKCKKVKLLTWFYFFFCVPSVYLWHSQFSARFLRIYDRSIIQPLR